MDSAAKNVKQHLPVLANSSEAGPAEFDPGKDDPKQPQGEAWDLAEQRMLLYLRVLNVPVVRRMELALEALRSTAADSAQTQWRHPVLRAMRILRALIAEQNLSTSQDIVRRVEHRCEQVKGSKVLRLNVRKAPGGPAVKQDITTPAGILVVAPPLLRSAMVPDDIDRKPWHSILDGCFGRLRRKDVERGAIKQRKERQCKQNNVP